MLSSDDIRSLFRRHGAEAVLGLCEPTLRAFDQAAPPKRSETAAIAFHNPKTAALCFDRIWAGAKPDIPSEIGFRTASTRETGLVFLTALLFALKQGEEAGHDVEQYVELVGRMVLDLLPDREQIEVPAIDQYSKIISDSIGAEYGIAVVPMYASSTQRDREYRTGDRAAVVAVLENVPVVAETDLTWQQVLEVRRDATMARKLRKFMHWLDGSMIGEPLSYIEDEVAVRLDDFTEATKTFGIVTTLGTLQLIVQTPAVLGGAAYLADMGATISRDWALAAGGALAATAVSVHIAQRLLNIKTQRATAAGEIAYVVELRRRAGAG